MMQSSSISSSSSGGAMKLSPLLAIFIVILHTPLACQAWTNTPLLSSTPSRLQQQQTLPHERNTIDGSGDNQKLMWWRQTILNVGRKRPTQLFASSNDDDYVSEHQDEAAIMEIADALISTTPSPQPPANNQVNGFVQKAQQAWTSPLNDAPPNDMPLNGDSISAAGGNTNTNTDIDANIYNEEEAKYLTLAKEAWTEFFSDQVSQEEFLNMALDAWRDASLVTTLQQDDAVVVGSLQSVEEEVQSDTTLFVEEQQVESEEHVEINGAQSDTASVEAQEALSFEEEEDNVETTTNEQKWGMPAFLSGLFSGSKKSSDAPAEASFAEENDEEDVPYGLRMKSSSASVLPPPSSSSAPAMDDIATTEKGGDYALNNKINSMKAKSLGEKQMTPPISKGVAPTLKSLDKKQIMPPPSPMNKGFTTPPMNKGVVKGKETSFSGGNKLSSTPTSFLNKGGTKKLGIQGKFAPKKLDIATKKKPQGKRGGLSFLKSDKLSKEYKADKNYNPLNKGVTVEKMKGLKIGQVSKAKSDDDTEASSEAHNKADKSKAPSNASDLPPATKLITAGMTAEEAEIIRKSRLLSEEETAALVEKASLEVTPVIVTEATEASPKVTPTAIISGMTAEEAERARMARLEISDKMKEKIKISAEKKGGVGNMPLKTIPLKGPMPKIPNTINVVSKGMPLKGGISAGAKQPKQPGKGLPFLKKSPSFGLDSTAKTTLPPLPLKEPKGDSDMKKGLSFPPLAKTSLGDAVTKKGFPPLPTLQKDASTIPMKGPIPKAAPSFSMEKKSLPPLPLKGKGNDAGMKKGMGLPPLAKKSFGDGAAAAAPGMKKGFPSAPLTIKGPMSKASHDEGGADESSAPKGHPLKGGVGMSMGEKQAGLPGKGMPFMKKAPSFSMENKTLPPLPLKGKGDDAGMKKGMGLPPLAKKSFGDGAAAAAAPGMKKGFPSAPMPMKGPMSKASDDEASGESESSAPKGHPLKGGVGMSMGEKQAGLPGKGMPFMKKAPGFSMENKTLPPLPLKGKGDDAGMKKGMGLPPLAKKSFGDGAAAGAPGAPGMKKGFPSAPLTMKGPMSKASDEASDDPSAPKGLPTSDVSKDLPRKGGISDTITESEVKAAKTKSNAVVFSPATPLISDGMTAEEAERIRLSRLQAEGETASKPVDEIVQPEDMPTTSKPLDETTSIKDTPTQITEGMTAEEAERARIARDTTTIDLAALQSRIQQLEDPKPTATPRPTINSKSVESADLALLKKTTALLVTKIDSALSHIDKLESKIEGLDEENLQLRRDNTELREELDDLKRTVALIDCLSEVGQ
eukprot:scaffold14455_cov96-Skeletonema_dohrnii-CCMP3373.AAC.7